MAEELQQHRRLAAIMFTDMVGYGVLSQTNEALVLELLNEHRKLLRERFGSHGGREIGKMGVRNLFCDGVVQLAKIRSDEATVAGRRARRAGEKVPDTFSSLAPFLPIFKEQRHASSRRIR